MQQLGNNMLNRTSHKAIMAICGEINSCETIEKQTISAFIVETSLSLAM
jgi:hypothetical protein